VVTVFEGDGALPADDEAAAIWAEVTGFPDERIIKLRRGRQLLADGRHRPLRPLHRDPLLDGRRTSPTSQASIRSPRVDGAGWFEIWNLVFMQFERQFEDGSWCRCPRPVIDTGMGLERVCVVQGVLSNYDTDLLRPVVDLAAVISGKTLRRLAGDDDVSMRVIADHARTTAFLISEGVFPDRVGRSYVLRRVMRRAIRHGHRLGIDKPFLHE
jgi:alanyl-tRNA synthetase